MSPLEILYKELDFQGGSLFSASDNPSSCTADDWLEKGEWLAAAKRAGVEKVFFVDNNPVIVFAECGIDIRDKVKAFNRAWCLARPRLLFLASPDEIAVYDLAQRPINEEIEDDWRSLKHLTVLHSLNNILTKLKGFHRDNIESGHLFGEKRFGGLKNRADQSLIRDLKAVRLELINAGLSGERVRFAHALIGRSIFIRYLEDRGVLTEEYYKEVADKKEEWKNLLLGPVDKVGVDASACNAFYPRILSNKEFTYALFEKLSHDFNGDMFPEDEEEKGVVEQVHLSLIQDLLYGDVGVQKKLFFYSYRFDIVPLDLISSIYEEFYYSSASADAKKSKTRQDGAYYTPPVLAEFIVSRLLTADVLAGDPRVLDPACGSGIFLVEAFRRIVRYKWSRKGRALTFDELKGILKNQIAGIEVNEEAARVAAFSLYFSMLHYLDPPAIDRQIKMGNRLPSLVASTRRSPNDFHSLLSANAFDAKLIESIPVWKEHFGDACADVIVGNPPWGSPGTKASAEAKKRQAIMLDWCCENDKAIVYKEPSQAFIWRAISLLKKDGKAGLLIPDGVFFNHHKNSKQFRKSWLYSCHLEEVFNFSHVRSFFFNGANSPFCAIFFSNSDFKGAPVKFWVARQVRATTTSQFVIFGKHDFCLLKDIDFEDETHWKAYLWGGPSDFEFIRSLKSIHSPLKEFLSEYGRGFEKCSGTKRAESLSKYKYFEEAVRYDPIDKLYDIPLGLYRIGNENLYSGKRIIVRRGILQRTNPKGTIVARFEVSPMAFTNDYHALRLNIEDDWAYKAVLGIIWSSLARYFFFHTSANWGRWCNEIRKEELLRLPVILDKNNPATSKVVAVVDELRNYQPHKLNLIQLDGVAGEEIEATRKNLELKLDDAVFELYGLVEEQKDLIKDCCDITLPFFYVPFKSVGRLPVVEEDDLSWLGDYVRIFCRRWNAYLGNDEEMRVEVHFGAHNNMVAVEFYPSDKHDPWCLKPKADAWGYILKQLSDNLSQPLGTSQVVLDGMVHVVSDDGIVIIKRNEKRFWTRTLAREDADSTLCKRMMDTMAHDPRNQ